MKLARIIVLFLLVMVSTTSFAARVRQVDYREKETAAPVSRFYVGAGAGSMKTDLAGVNETSVSWSLLAGTAINRNLAIEVAYTNLGSTDLGSTEYLKGTAYSLSLHGNIPVTRSVSMFAKLGFANTGVYVESAGSNGTTYSTAAPTIGLGVAVNITRRADLRIAYDNYKFTKDDINTSNADITSLSLIFKF